MTVATQSPNGNRAPEGAPPAGAPQQPPAGPASLPPGIFPNRRRLDNRFPVLAFTIRTFGLPWFEVLLTTDRSLFDPAQATRRSPANFYAGRQDGGLIRSAGDETAYVVPTAVLRRFADARPRASEIFYSVAAYRSPDGPPTLALPPQVLSATAPSVLLSGDFHAQALASILAIPAEKLHPMSVEPGPEAGALSGSDYEDEDLALGQESWSSEDAEEEELSQATAAWMDDPEALALDADGWLEGHRDEWADGAPEAAEALSFHDVYGQGLAGEDPQYEPDDQEAAGLAYGDEPYADEPYADEPYADEPYAGASLGAGEGADADAYDDQEAAGLAYADEPYADEPYADASLGAGEAGDPDAYGQRDDAAAFAYDDGYDDAMEGGPQWAEGLESTFPAGAQEPATLADIDDEQLEQELASGDFDEPYGEEQGYAGAFDAAPAPGAPAAPAPAGPRQLDIPAKIGLVTKIGRLFETPDGYRGINADTEFSNPRLPQYQRWHAGLTYGFVGFTQDSGSLGRLLRMMRERDPARFRELFGPHDEELVRVTNLQGPSSRRVPGGRSIRVQPVGGADLWTEPWLSRFRVAGDHPPFQAAQNELAVRAFLDPMLPFAAGFGMDTERALALLVDRAIQMGVRGAGRWLIGAIGPIRTDAIRQQAMGALNVGGIRQFQEANGLWVDGDFGPVTHAAMVAALRRLGPASPIPIPNREQLMDAIVARAVGEGVFWHQRPQTIRRSAEFGDAALTWSSRVPAAAR